MRNTVAAVLIALSFLAAPLDAQTTGTPGFNDYTVNGISSASTSCTTATIPFATPISFSVSTCPFSPVFLLFSPCACSPGFLTLPPVRCQGLVFSQSLDLQMSSTCSLSVIAGIADAAGNFTLTLPSCPSGATFATQAVTRCCAPFLLTQAYDVVCL